MILVAATRARQPLGARHLHQATPPKPPEKPSTAWARSVSTNDPFKKVTTPRAPPSLVQQVDMVFTWRNPRRKDGLQDDTHNRENDALRCRCHHHQQEAGEAFTRRIMSYLRVHSSTKQEVPRGRYI